MTHKTLAIIVAAVLVAALLAHFIFHASLFTIFGLFAIAAVFYFIYLGWSKSRKPRS